MENDAFIRCEGLVKTYKIGERELLALQGLDLTIRRGELLGIVGASGSGKSTLMNILGGLDRPSAGEVMVDGLDLLHMDDLAMDRYRSTRVGFVWQQGARNLIHYLSAEENVMLPITINGGGQRKAARRAAELLEMVGLAPRRRHRLEELSGGEQQRVAIAVALVNHPILLLADEPTGEVDSTTAAGIYKIFQDLNQNFGQTTIIVSHDQAISRYMERVVAIRDGRIATESVRRNGEMVHVTPSRGEAKADLPTGQPPLASPLPAAPPPAPLEEVALVDSSGFVQIPPELRQQAGLGRRVTLEVVPKGLLVTPASPEVSRRGEAKTDLPAGTGEAKTVLPGRATPHASPLPASPQPDASAHPPRKLSLLERLRQPAPPRRQP